MNWFYSLLAKLRGKNYASTPEAVIKSQLSELRPLPLGVTEFHEWSDRIISGAMLSAEPHSLKFALAEMIMHLKPTQDHCDDAYFIHCLRKGAANQVAYEMMKTIREARKPETKVSADIPAEATAVQ